ncbi:MAG: S8 family serine peptidase, partial [Roseiflexaceae bacterium]
MGVVLAALALLGGVVPATIAAPRQQLGVSSTYVVVYAANVSLDTAHAAISAAGGTIVKENAGVGVATVSTSNPNFIAAVRQQPALYGVSRNASVGVAPQAARRQQDQREIEQLTQERQASKNQPAAARLQSARSRKPDAEPLADLQWDLQMIHATASGSYRKQLGSKRVLVGVIDTGIDGSHPDIAPNFDAALSRNFTQDIELIDGPCAEEPDQSCDDPANVDENGHGTHVAGIIGAALNGLGIAGVAPNVTLVNLRAGQDSGYFFLQSTVDALTYAGDIGVDVVNMSYYTDPWLYNCASNPADSPEDQLEQRTIIEGTQRALRYAHNRGVTLVAAEGNEHSDIGHPASDSTSPDFPPDAARTRTVDNSCLTMPTEGNNVIAV